MEKYTNTNNDQAQLSYILDKMADYLLAGQEIEFSDLLLDWYREGFQCHFVPRPTDIDPLKLAVKASIIERMVVVFNAPPHNKAQSVPNWCGEVSAVEKPVNLQSSRLLEDELFCEDFEKRNLYVVKNFMFFV